MENLFLILAGVFMLATLGILGIGVGTMGQSNGFGRRYGNKLMRLRILFQGLAILCFILFLLAR